jgi:hypothetical protein
VFLILFGLSFAVLAECPPPAGVYISPSSVQRVNWMAGAPPTCIAKFFSNWEKKHPLNANDEKERAINVSCTAAVKQMMTYAERNVRRFHCDDGSGNVLFQSKIAFATVNHAFTAGKDSVYIKQPASMLETCYIEQKRFDPRTNLKMSFQNPINYGEDQMKLGDRSWDNGSAGDFAVTTTKLPIDDVDRAPVPVMSYADVNSIVKKNGSIGLFMASAFAPARETQNCFAMTECTGFGPNYPPEGASSSVYINNCPGIRGFSGSPLFTLMKDSSGKCTGFALVAMHRGGNVLTEKKGDIVTEPAGRPFHFDADRADDETVGNNWSLAVGFDNVFRSWLAEASGIKLIEQTVPSTPLKPAGDNL